MSKQREIKLSCPRCGRRIDVSIWDAVDADMKPDLPQLLISGEFFRHKCPECDAKISLEMPLLYNDPVNHARVWLLQKGRDIAAEKEKLGAHAGAALPPDRTRRVSGNNELREKVSALEAGRDDRVIEVVKYLELQDFRLKYPAEKVAGVRYSYLSKRETLVFFNEEGGEHETAFNVRTYEIWEGYLQAILRSMDTPEYSVIDQKYAEDVLYGYFGQMMGEARAKGISVLQLRRESKPPEINVPDLSKTQPKKKKKKGGRGILWIIIALVAVLIAASAFVVLKYNVLAPKTPQQKIEESVEAGLDGVAAAVGDEIINFVPPAGE